MGDSSIGQLIRDLLARRGEEAERVTRDIGGREALAAMAAMFTIAVERQFGDAADPAAVSRFVSDVRARYPNGYQVDQVLAEALVRAALGEEELLEGLDMNSAGAVETFLATAIIDSKRYSNAELEDFIHEAEDFALQGLREISE